MSPSEIQDKAKAVRPFPYGPWQNPPAFGPACGPKTTVDRLADQMVKDKAKQPKVIPPQPRVGCEVPSYSSFPTWLCGGVRTSPWPPEPKR